MYLLYITEFLKIFNVNIIIIQITVINNKKITNCSFLTII
jgi:hypothetical protein